jgi:hypothetical protein
MLSMFVQRPRVGELWGRELARLAPALTRDFSGADDGTRTRDPYLGKVAGHVL